MVPRFVPLLAFRMGPGPLPPDDSGAIALQKARPHRPHAAHCGGGRSGEEWRPGGIGSWPLGWRCSSEQQMENDGKRRQWYREVMGK